MWTIYAIYIILHFIEVNGQAVVIHASPAGAVPLGSTVTITCTFPNRTVKPTAFVWSHDGNHIQTILRNKRFHLAHRKTVPPQTSITIYRTNEEDTGSWACTAHFPGSRTRESYSSSGHYVLLVGAPQIVHLTEELRVSIGDIVTLYCNASAEPPPNITWTRLAPMSLLPAPISKEMLEGNQLSYTVRAVSDQGTYRCTAMNTHGSAFRSVRVNVNHAPYFIEKPASVLKGYLGIPIAMTVTISSYPPPSVTWYKDGVVVADPRVISSAEPLGIHSLQLSPNNTDFGRYSCVAQNEYGRIQQSLLLIPHGPPPRPVSVIPTLITPTTVKLKVGNTELAGGVPVTKYRLAYREVGTTSQRHDWFKSSDVIILGRLQSRTTYMIYLSAGNQVGWSEYAEAVYVTTLQTPDPTAQPLTTLVINRPSVDPRNDITMSTPNNSVPVAATVSHIITTKSADSSVKTTVHKTTTPFSGEWDSITQPPPIEGAVLSYDQTNDTAEYVPRNEPSTHHPSTLVIIFLVVAAVVCMMVIGFCLFMASSIPANPCIKKRSRLRDDLRESLYEDFAGPISNGGTIQYRARPLPSLITTFLTPSPTINFEFPSEGIVIGNLIGQGSFGVVFEAEAFGILEPNVGTKVAVKTLKEDYSEEHEIAFKKELDVMSRLKQHPFIVRFLGCCTTSDVQLIIMERLAEGNLLTHLRKSKQHVTNHVTRRVSLRTTLSPCDLIRYGYEIANGMAYLSTMKCIHRDLAARNVLLSRDDVCKLTDFNLARDVIKDGLSQKRTQGRSSLRWMALESLLENSFTIRSNVWSFGVVLWEIVTIGSYPYAGITSSKLTRHLLEGNRMAKPEHCSQDVYSLMTQCWQSDPKKRPKFEELSKKLESTLSESRNYLVLDEFAECIYECAS